MVKPSPQEMTWRPPEPGTASSVHVEREVTGWLGDQEPGASLYRWGLLLGSSFGDAITVSAVIPVQNRAQLDSEMAVRHAAPVVGICAWGRASDEREQLRLFEELFPKSGHVLLFAQATNKGAPEIHVFFQDGKRAPMHAPRGFAWRPLVTWTLAVLAVVLGSWYLFQPAEQEVISPIQSQGQTQTEPVVEQPKAAAVPDSVPVAPPAPVAPTPSKKPALETGSKSGNSGRRAGGATRSRPRIVEQDSSRERAKSRKWSRPFAWVRDSTWKPISERWSRRGQ